MQPAIDALFYTLDQTGNSCAGLSILFVNAQPHSDIHTLITNNDVTCAQWFKPKYDLLQNFDFTLITTLPADQTFDLVLYAYPKNQAEGLSYLGQCLNALNENGTLFITAENNAGGSRLPKIFKSFKDGVDWQSHSKYKSRVIEYRHTSNAPKNAVSEWIKNGALQYHDAIGFYTMPGLFGWNKIDTGSTLLLDTMPDKLSGAGADFGCGYGFLAKHVFENHNNITGLYCIDGDERALSAAKVNLETYQKAHYIWHDLTSGRPPKTPPLDWIIMNPPFHMDNDTNSHIGQKFIETAGKSLKSGGILYMVANTHLPYEKFLTEYFRSAKVQAQNKGFKVVHAKK